jgi:hypothetical protein
MEKKDFVHFLVNYFESQNVIPSPTAIDSLTSSYYLNQSLLDTLDRRTIYKNSEKILKEVLRTYKQRTHDSTRKTKVRDVDVRPVLKRRFCSMPPFCKEK